MAPFIPCFVPFCLIATHSHFYLPSLLTLLPSIFSLCLSLSLAHAHARVMSHSPSNSLLSRKQICDVSWFVLLLARVFALQKKNSFKHIFGQYVTQISAVRLQTFFGWDRKNIRLTRGSQCFEEAKHISAMFSKIWGVVEEYKIELLSLGSFAPWF